MCVEGERQRTDDHIQGPVAEKLKKDKKLKLKITGGEGFDPYSDIRVGTFSVLQKKAESKIQERRTCEERSTGHGACAGGHSEGKPLMCAWARPAD